jgi:flagellar basal-body rod protein FlgC
MSIESIFGIATSALDAQSQRITLIAQNLANANSVDSADGGPYQRQIPLFESQAVGEEDTAGVGVKIAAVLHDQAPARQIYDPANPFADASGMVKESSVNPIYEMVDMMQASRSYQASLSMVETARTAALKTIDLLK